MTDEDKVAVASRLAAALINRGIVLHTTGSPPAEEWAAKIFENVYKALPTLPGISQTS